MSTSRSEEEDWIKIDLHIHTLDDPKDAVDFSAHQLLERARSLGFRVLAITLHDAVFDRKEVFADAAAMGILLIPAVEVRLLGADVIVLNVTAEEIAQVMVFDQQLVPGKDRALFRLFHLTFKRDDAFPARLVKKVVQHFQGCHILLPGEFRSFENPHDPTNDLLKNVQRIGDQHRSYPCSSNDHQFGRLEQHPDITVFHQVAGYDGSKRDYDSNDGKHGA